MAEQRDAREIAAEWLHDQLTDEDAGPWREATEWVREWWATNLADPLLAVLAAGGWSVERLDPAGVGLYDLSDPDRPRRVMVPLYRVISPSTREADS